MTPTAPTRRSRFSCSRSTTCRTRGRRSRVLVVHTRGRRRGDLVSRVRDLRRPKVNINKGSFWDRECRELISKEVGMWMIQGGHAPWPTGSPPKFRVRLAGLDGSRCWDWPSRGLESVHGDNIAPGIVSCCRRFAGRWTASSDPQSGVKEPTGYLFNGMWSDVEDDAGQFQLRKHVVDMPPGTRRSLRVRADALGRWAFHCHLLYHINCPIRS